MTETNYLILSRSLTDLILNLSKKFMQICTLIRFASSTKEYSFKYDCNRDNKDKGPFTIYIDTHEGFRELINVYFFYIAIALDSQMRRQNGKGFETLKKKSTHFVSCPTAIKGDQILDSAC